MIKTFLLFLFALSFSTGAFSDALSEIQAFIEESTSSGRIKIHEEGWKTRLPKFPEVEFAEGVTYEWVIETSEGMMVAELNEDAAPDHVRNILYLSSLGYYDGLTFHRIMPNFMAQGGCPNGNGRGGPGYSVDLEVSPKYKHDRAGILSMARSSNPNSAGSQFFITFQETPFLDGDYSVFGVVKQGLDVIEKLEEAANPRSNGVPPLKTITITSSSVRKAPADPAP